MWHREELRVVIKRRIGFRGVVTATLVLALIPTLVPVDAAGPRRNFTIAVGSELLVHRSIAALAEGYAPAI